MSSEIQKIQDKFITHKGLLQKVLSKDIVKMKFRNESVEFTRNVLQLMGYEDTELMLGKLNKRELDQTLKKFFQNESEKDSKFEMVQLKKEDKDQK